MNKHEDCDERLCTYASRNHSYEEAVKFLREFLQNSPLLLTAEMEHRFENDVVCYRKYVIQFDYTVLGCTFASGNRHPFHSQIGCNTRNHDVAKLLKQHQCRSNLRTSVIGKTYPGNDHITLSMHVPNRCSPLLPRALSSCIPGPSGRTDQIPFSLEQRL